MEIDSDAQAKVIYVTSHMPQLQHKMLELTPAFSKFNTRKGLIIAL